MKITTVLHGYRVANCYILASGNSCAVVDPASDAQGIYKKASELGLTIEKILLTHTHFDHLLVVNELCDIVNCPVYVHKGDLSSLYDVSKNLSLLATGIEYTITSAIQVYPVSDGDKIQIGDESVTVMGTPGHTPGSCLYISDDFIVTGDTLFARCIGRTDLPGGNNEEMRASLSKIKKLKKNYVLYPGHGQSTTLFDEKLYNPYLSDE